MLNKSDYCICIPVRPPRRIVVQRNEETGMEFNENRGGQPFRASPFVLMFRLPRRLWLAWRQQARSRKALARLSDAQLRDIGLTSDDIKRYR
ncbi:DUF1127 domain-containing protein [Erwinia sp.]|uniref:DUF1127 domain-containing protein n=1 Tax=Erwinia citreus TaxID=558 RepID=UPI0039171ABD